MTPRARLVNVFPSYKEAKRIVLAAGIHSVVSYRKWHKTCQQRMPYHPQRVYREDWINWNNFFSKKDILSYDEAKKTVQKNNIRNRTEYMSWYKSCELHLPSNPPKEYNEDWIDWHVFFGFKTKYVSYKVAKSLVTGEGIRTHREYMTWYRQAEQRLPSAPQFTYPEWTSWYDFLDKSIIQ